jgi:type I restriction enzyme M protein
LLFTVISQTAALNTNIAEIIAPFKAELNTNSTDLEQLKKAITVLEKTLKAEPEQSTATKAKIANLLNAQRVLKDLMREYLTLRKDTAILKAKIAQLDAFFEAIGGMITEAEAKHLILKKHFDRYLNAERRALTAAYENLYDKYALSAQNIEADRTKTMDDLNAFLKELKYL